MSELRRFLCSSDLYDISGAAEEGDEEEILAEDAEHAACRHVEDLEEMNDEWESVNDMIEVKVRESERTVVEVYLVTSRPHPVYSARKKT